MSAALIDSDQSYPLAALIDHFLADLTRRRKSPYTVAGYREVLTAAREDLGWQTLADIGRLAFRAWMDSEAHLAPSTQKWHWAVFRSFCRWLDDEDYPVDQSVFKVRGPKIPIREPETLSSEEVRAILKVVWHPYPRCPALTKKHRQLHRRLVRGWLMVRVLYCTGVRVGELVALTPEDLVEGPQSYLSVRRGKGDKPRIVPLPEDGVLARDLRRFIIEHVPATTPIFDLSTHGVNAQLHRFAELAGLKRRIYPHLFRHTFATNYMADGGSELKLQNTMGHTTLQMTSRYAHFRKSNILGGWTAKDPGGKS